MNENEREIMQRRSFSWEIVRDRLEKKKNEKERKYGLKKRVVTGLLEVNRQVMKALSMAIMQ